MTIEQHLRTLIGDLVFQIASLSTQLEAANAKNQALLERRDQGACDDQRAGPRDGATGLSGGAGVRPESDSGPVNECPPRNLYPKVPRS